MGATGAFDQYMQPGQFFQTDRHLPGAAMNLTRFIRQQWRILPEAPAPAGVQRLSQSDDWQHIRKIKLQFADHLCEQCRRPASPGNPLDVHHLTYDRFGHDEPVTDLQCNVECHGRPRAQVRVGYPERDMYIGIPDV